MLLNKQTEAQERSSGLTQESELRPEPTPSESYFRSQLKT